MESLEAFDRHEVSSMADPVQARARATFKSRYGLIRTGQIFTSEKAYADEMVIRGNVEIIADKPQPDRHQAFARAPLIAGKGHATENQPHPSQNLDSAAPQDNGTAKPASSSPQGRRSKRKTSTTPGEKLA